MSFDDQKLNRILTNAEFVLQVDDVRMIDRYNSKNPSIGTLYLTATHMIFVDPEANKETWVSEYLSFFCVVSGLNQ